MSQADDQSPEVNTLQCFNIPRAERIFGTQGYGMQLYRAAGRYAIEQARQGSPLAATSSGSQLERFWVMNLRPTDNPPLEFLQRPYVEFRQTIRQMAFELAVDSLGERTTSITHHTVPANGEMSVATRTLEDFPGVAVRAITNGDFPDVTTNVEAESVADYFASDLKNLADLAVIGFFRLRFPPQSQ